MDTKKACIIAFIGFIIAIAGYSLAQLALDAANINNVFAVVVNNTDKGYPTGTQERLYNTTYWANDSPIQVYLIMHIVGTGTPEMFYLSSSINDTEILNTSRDRTLTNNLHEHFPQTFIVPKGANYTVRNSTNAFEVEWREYPILSGKNGTLSINQTVLGNSFNSTYDATTKDFNSNFSAHTFPNDSIVGVQKNDSYFNGTVFPQSTNFRNDSIVSNNNTLTLSKVNKTGDTSTGLQTFDAGINATNGSINANGNLLAPLTPTFSGWTQNPGTNSQLALEEVDGTISTSGTIAGSNVATITYNLGSVKRVTVSSYAHLSSGALQFGVIQGSTDNVNYFNQAVFSQAIGASIYLSSSYVGNIQYVRFLYQASGGATIDTISHRVYNI